jgi:hypothetical protein
MKMLSSLPWWMFDLGTKQLITSGTIPEGSISDKKAVIITETPIPGRNFQPIASGGNGNRKVSFKLPILSRTVAIGDVGLIKQFEALRNQSRGLFGLRPKGQFAQNPKVLYSWGIGSLPLEWYVSRCDFDNRADMVNRAGMPQYTMVDIELILDETSKLYIAEEAFRSAMILTGMSQGATGIIVPGRA